MKVATVISGSGWEPRFVAEAVAQATVRVVARCATASELAAELPNIDAVLIGADVAWMGRHAVDFWHRSGIAVVGVGTNAPERAMLDRAGCDAVVSDPVNPVEILAVTSPRQETATPGTIVSVGGARGAPGRTEVAIAVAWAGSRHGSVLLLEADKEAPSLGLRLCLPPPVGLSPVRVGPIEAVALPVSPGPLSRSMLDRFLIAASDRYSLVVIDCGPDLDRGVGVMVVDPSPVGLIRAARWLASWPGDPPLLVGNRIDGESDVRKVRAATGLEPSAVVPLCQVPEGRPSPVAVEALASMVAGLVARGQRAAL